MLLDHTEKTIKDDIFVYSAIFSLYLSSLVLEVIINTYLFLIMKTLCRKPKI